MVSVKLDPILRKQAIIQAPPGQNAGVEVGSTYMAIINKFGKSFSFMVEILGVESGSGPDLVMVVDKRRVGSLAKGDEVDLYPYNFSNASRRYGPPMTAVR